VYNTQLVGNWVENVEDRTNTGAPAYIGLLPYQYGVSQSLGTAALGVEVKNNTLVARPSYKTSFVNNNELGREGYYNHFLAQFIGPMSDIPVTLGTIFQNNTARNTANAFYLSSGAHNTLICSTTLNNVDNLVDDRVLHNAAKASVNTVRECSASTVQPPNSRPRPTADPKTNTPIPRNGGATRVLPLTGSSPNGYITGFTITELPPASQGTLYLGTDPISQHSALSVEQGQQLSFEPRTSFTGEVVFTYTSIDDHGLVSLGADFVIPVSNPLPVVLTQFTAKARNTDALLAWATAAELNHSYFAVERSVDGTSFQTVHTVRGSGTSTTGMAYSFEDYGVGAHTPGMVYYRLRQVDQDSTTTYSAVRAVSFAAPATAALNIYPNPAANELRINLSNPGARLTVYSATGLALLDTRTATKEGVLDIQKLPAGTYVLLVRPDQGTCLRQQFVKEKT
ncbi:T9SS type A sorting domain-containing protein, partial [Hymenobacter fodinae]